MNYAIRCDVRKNKFVILRSLIGLEFLKECPPLHQVSTHVDLRNILLVDLVCAAYKNLIRVALSASQLKFFKNSLVWGTSYPCAFCHPFLFLR